MPIEVSVQTNIAEVQKKLTEIQKTQLPFATAQTITQVVKQIQDAEIKRAIQIFNNRKVWYKPQQPTGIKVKTASKKDWPNCKGSVFTDAYFMKLQESGGIKLPLRSKNLLVPTSNVAKSMQNALGPEKVLAQKNVFSNRKGIFKKTGGKKNPVVKKMFTRTPSANIKPIFQFGETARRLALANFPSKFLQNLAKAIR